MVIRSGPAKRLLKRVLKNLKDEGALIVRGNHFEVLNIEALRRISKVG